MRHLAHLVDASRRCITQTPPLHRQRLPKATPKTPAPPRPIYQRRRRFINLIVVASYIYMKSYISRIIYLYDFISTQLSPSLLPAPPACILPFTIYGF
jgi:hypothetical protein